MAGLPLVTGATGFAGGHLLDSLVQTGPAVAAWFNAVGAGIDPAYMGLGPVHAATPILQRHGLGLNDLDAWEINVAFDLIKKARGFT